VHRSGDARPVAGEFFFDEALIEGDPGVALDADERPIRSSIEDHRMDDPAVGQNRVPEFFEAGAAFALIVAGRTEREVNLLDCWCLGIHFQEFYNSWICMIEFNVRDGHRLENPALDHKYFL